jgi:hypothetical protein
MKIGRQQLLGLLKKYNIPAGRGHSTSTISVLAQKKI